MARVVVIGAGAMGLAAAHRAIGLGHAVDLIEADDVAGGMAAHFDFGGLSIERFYHFICKSDEPTFDLMRELGIADRLRWQPTSMGYFMNDKIHPWGDPLALLRFPHLSLTQKIRSGWQMFRTTRAKDFKDIEGLTAHQWISAGSGEDVYRMLWKRLLDLKFYELAEDISASWIATRIRRVGTSRRSLFQEELGYIEGGSQTLVDSLVKAFTHQGGRVHLSTPVRRVNSEAGRVTSVEVADRVFAADTVISTVPTPLVPMLVPELPDTAKQAYAAIRNIGVICLVFKLRKPISKHFWLNVSAPDIDIPGLIEFSNLRPMDDHIIYVPYYMPTAHPKWQWSDERILCEAFSYLCRINSKLQEVDLIEARANRLRYAQPVCEPNFKTKLPSIQTPISGLLVADTCYYYPEDRGIAESVRYGRMMAEMI